MELTEEDILTEIFNLLDNYHLYMSTADTSEIISNIDNLKGLVNGIIESIYEHRELVLKSLTMRYNPNLHAWYNLTIMMEDNEVW